MHYTQWLAANKLTLNVSKSKFMIVSKKRKIHHQISVKINEEELEQCQSYKYLGVHIDKNLSWKAHIEHLCKKISKS